MMHVLSTANTRYKAILF